MWLNFSKYFPHFREVLPVLQHGSARLFVPSAATLLLLQEANWSGARQVSTLDLELRSGIFFFTIISN